MYRDVLRALTALAVSVLLLLAVQLKELVLRILYI
jgi:hypothetical protein